MKLETKATIRTPWGQGGESDKLEAFEIESIGNYRSEETFIHAWEDVEDEEEARFKARGYLESLIGKEPARGEVTFSFALWEEGEGKRKSAEIRYVRLGDKAGRFLLDHSSLFRGYVSRKRKYDDPRYHQGRFRKNGVIIEWDKCNHASTAYSIREYYYWQTLDKVSISLCALDPWRWRDEK